MSMPDYQWDLEERVEDCIVAHIEKHVGRVAMIIPARTVVQARYPLVVVEATQSGNHSDTGRFTGRRQMDVVVAVCTEAVNEAGPEGSQQALEDARTAHRVIKSQVIGALAGNTVHDELNEIGTAAVAFSQCYMTIQRRDAGSGLLVTEQVLDVIAQPKEL